MHRQFLYLSQMTPQANYRHLGDITQQATSLNRRDRIHAALLFDGYRFCQRVQGPAEAVGALLMRLHKDARHSGMRMLADELLQPGAVNWPVSTCPWLSGYCDALEFDAFDTGSALQGQAALEHFERILRHADLRP